MAKLKYFLAFTLPIELRNKVVDSLFERHVGSSARWARRWYLDWNALSLMQAQGHTIGGHGFAHEAYSHFSATQCREDAARVAAMLSEGLGPDSRPFSYPFGATSPEAEEAVAQAGFVQAFTTREAPVERSCGMLDMPRVDTIHVRLTKEETSPCSP